MRVRSSSLLPEPVVPASRQCGPSAARSTSNGPASPTPMGADRPAGGELADHRTAMAAAKPSISSPSSDAFSKSSRRTRSGNREPGAAASGSSRRARLRAAASATPSATPAVSKATAAAPRPGRRRRAGGPVSTTSVQPAGSNSGFSSSHSPAAGRPAPKRISRKARRCSSGRRGWSAVIIVTGAEPAGAGTAKADSKDSISVAEQASNRRSEREPAKVWGAHLIQSHWRGRSVMTPIRTSAGPWAAASWHKTA